jgi:hypothetical protein
MPRKSSDGPAHSNDRSIASPKHANTKSAPAIDINSDSSDSANEAPPRRSAKKSEEAPGLSNEESNKPEQDDEQENEADDGEGDENNEEEEELYGLPQRTKQAPPLISLTYQNTAMLWRKSSTISLKMWVPPS